MAAITLSCAYCNQKFEKQRSEYNRRVRLGKDKFYCSLSCSSKRDDNIKHIIANRSHYPIWKHSGNNQDEYSKFRPFLKLIRQRNKEYDITLVYLKELWESQDGTCPFTGFKLETRLYNGKDKPLNIRSASLDRIDNAKGYIKGNVRFVSVMFNLARNNLSDAAVIEFAQAVVRTTGAK